jgi:polar amino acid transport system substrate-binding protein
MSRRWRVGALAGALALMLAGSTAVARPLDVIRERGVLSLCAHANALPFASRTATPPGFQIELARALAAALGVGLHVEWVTSGAQFRVADCDIVLDTIAVPEAQAERRLELSRSYQRSGVGLVVHTAARDIASFGDLTGHRVGARNRSLAAMFLGQRGVRLTFFPDEDEMIEAVARGEVEAAAVSPATVGYFKLRHPDAPVRFMHAYETEPELRWDLAVGLRRADAPFRAAIDAAVDRLVADGTVRAIYARYGIEHRPPLGR